MIYQLYFILKTLWLKKCEKSSKKSVKKIDSIDNFKYYYDLLILTYYWLLSAEVRKRACWVLAMAMRLMREKGQFGQYEL